MARPTALSILRPVLAAPLIHAPGPATQSRSVPTVDPNGNPANGWYPEQRLTLTAALRGYTVEAAYAEFEESRRKVQSKKENSPT